MIIDSLPKHHEVLAEKLSLKHWQSGVLGDLLYWHDIQKSNIRIKMDRHLIKSVNMGPQAGHTYLARQLAMKECPIRTKVYVTDTMCLGQFSNLILKPEKCHEVVDVMQSDWFAGYNGDPVDLIVFDMHNIPASHYEKSLDCLFSSVPTTTAVLLLQPGNNF